MIEDTKITNDYDYKNSMREFLYPLYGKNCISDIPNAILELFAIRAKKVNSKIDRYIRSWKGGNRNIVLMVIDGFGFYQFLRQYKKHRIFTNLISEGEFFPITSVYPSQTTNALTTLNTGLFPQEHSLFEYFIYLKEADMVIDTLWFEHIDGEQRIKLIDRGFNARILFEGETIHETLRENGVATFAHVPASSAYSVCSSLIFKGSEIVASVKISDMIVRLRKNLEKSKGDTYFFVHLDTLDTIAHLYGPDSQEYEAEFSAISYLLKRELTEKIAPKVAKETLLLLTADHGTISIDPEETVYINSIPSVLDNLKYGGNGKRISPIGSPRDVFLHVKEEKLEETRDLLSRKLSERAQVTETKEELKKGLFGKGNTSDRFLERAGNLLILPYRNETIWVQCSEARRARFYGHHGGLSKEEMLVPFAVAKLDRLKK